MEKSKIDWCDSSWNPITGCYHECPYCYARKTANRFKGCDDCPDGNCSEEVVALDVRKSVTTKNGLVKNAAYPFGFIPTFHRYRLNDLKTKNYGKVIFVCSMADMFGEWVPDEWIEDIFNACLSAPDHIYLFLTKNPERYLRLAQNDRLPKFDNFWYGTTVTTTKENFFFSDEYNCFLSIEPMLAPFEFEEGTPEAIQFVKWFIFGAETGNRKDKIVPERFWIEGVTEKLLALGKYVFMKDSLKPIMGEELTRQFPWEKIE